MCEGVGLNGKGRQAMYCSLTKWVVCFTSGQLKDWEEEGRV